MGLARLDIQLNVDKSRGSPADLAYSWIDELVERVAGPEAAALKSRGGTEGPNTECSEISVHRYIGGLPKYKKRKLSTKSLDWLQKELATGIPQRTEVRVGYNDADGYVDKTYVSAVIKPLRESPGWLVLTADVLAGDSPTRPPARPSSDTTSTPWPPSPIG